ncbi:class I SAM-dependent methyltransferase [Pseudonocardia alni]|uniref:class I SAM-dependent methyltransferase n=1 Tax=Pseudonocardia alni TaxID=33907 RepID=UPI00367E9146
MPSTEKVDLRGAAATLLMTLYMRRLDARSRRPILGDPWAEPVWDRIEHDVHGLWQFTGDVSTIVCRAAILDGWTREFLSTEPAGQVLHLGCGLDSRPLRVGVPSTCRWVDVDQPEVMEVRRRLYDLPDSIEQVPGSVTDDDWWSAVDPTLPTLVVAEGLFMYVPADAVHATVDRVVSGTPRGDAGVRRRRPVDGACLALDADVPRRRYRVPVVVESRGVRAPAPVADRARRHLDLRRGVPA